MFVWGIAIGQMVGWGTLYWPFSLMIGPMEAELGWSRAQLNGALAFGLLLSGFATIPFGRWIDGRRGRLLVTGCATLGAAMLVAWSSLDSLWLFYLVWAFLGLAMAGTIQDVVYAIVLANVSNYRRALIHINLAIGLSSTVFLPATAFMIGEIGWRGSLLVLAGVQLLLAALPAPFLLRRTGGAGVQAAADGDDGMLASSGVPSTARPLRRILAAPAFWALTLCFSVQTLTLNGIVFHVVPLFQERGLALEDIVFGWALMGPAQVLGRFALLLIGERSPSATVGRVVVMLFPLVFLHLVFFADSFAGVVVFAMMFGATNGIMAIIRLTAIAEILGHHNYGAITGMMNFVMTLPRTLAPIAVAFLWQGYGDYDAVIWIMVGLSVIGALAFWVGSGRSMRLV